MWVVCYCLLVNSVDLCDSCLNSLWFGVLILTVLLVFGSCFVIWLFLCYCWLFMCIVVYIVLLCVWIARGVCFGLVAIGGFLFWCSGLVYLFLGLRGCMGFGLLVGCCFVDNVDYFFVICLDC